MIENYKALVARERDNGKVTAEIEQVPFDFLPENEVLIKVAYAALNYKDGLSATGHRGVTRKYPHTPGVDAAGTVVSDKSGKWKEGDQVICTSYDLGMNTNGGFAEYISVPAAWVVPLPSNMDLQKSMVLGTAAYTAGLALYKMEKCGQHPEMGPIVVTGSTGGVGSMAVMLLQRAGYEVHAVTGKSEQADYLHSLGTSKILTREDVDDTSGRPLMRPQWAGAIDNVGGNTLATLLKACDRNGSVASIGLVASAEFSTTVYPFILNGVNLLGVDSAETPYAVREEIWNKLANEWAFVIPAKSTQLVQLDAIPEWIGKILKGQTVGRVVAEIG